MATFTDTFSSGWGTLILEVTESDTSISSNSGKISWKLKIKAITGSPSHNNGGASISVTIGGVRRYSSTKFDVRGLSAGSTKTIASGSFTKTHSSDGSLSLSCSASADSGVTYGYASVSGTFHGTTIPRATTPVIKNSAGTSTVSSAGLGSVVRIDVTGKASSAFTHDVTYKLGSKTGTIYTGLSQYANWTVPTSLADSLPSSTSGTMTITCKTKNGSTTVGTKSVTLKITVPDTAAYRPSISGITASELTEEVAAKFEGLFLKSKSKLKISVSRAAGDGAEVRKTTVKINGETHTGQTINTGVLKWYEDLSCVVTVEDTRGRTTSKTYTVSVVNYYNPIIESFSVDRCDQDGTLNDEGAYFKASYAVDIAPVNNKNAKTAKIRYRRQGTTTWSTKTITLSSYTANGSAIIAASTEYTYEVEFEISDSFETPVVASETLSTAFTLVDHHSSGTGISFGKVAEKAHTMDVALDLLVKGVDHTIEETDFDEQIEMVEGTVSSERKLPALLKSIITYFKNRISKIDSDTGWKPLTLSTNWEPYDSSGNYVVYRKIGRIVEIRAYLIAAISTQTNSTWLVAYGLPADCVPKSYTVRSECAHHSTTTCTISVPYSLSEDAGEVQVTVKLLKGYSLWFHLMYMV